MKLSIGLATRGRPELLERTIDRTLASMELDTSLVILCDDDDEATVKAARNNDVAWSIAPREDSLGEKYNRLMRVAPADVYLAMVDYAPFVTYGFDRKILEAAALFPDGIGVVYNHWANMSFPQMNAVTHRMAEIMGGVYPPYFPFWFVDHWLDDIARMIGRITFADVKTDATKRPGTQDKRDPAFWATLYDSLRGERHAIADRLLAEMDVTDAQRAMLRNIRPWIDERSELVNDHVRMTAAQCPPGPEPDDRYRRIKARAVARMRQAYEELQAA